MKTAPRTAVYLINGANESRLNDAVGRHFDLLPRGAVKMLECYVDNRIVESLIVQVELSRLNESVKKSEVIQFAKDLGKDFNYGHVLATLKHFRERGWEVDC